MPNWCANGITVRGKDKEQVKRLVEAFDQGKFCNAVIPVPEELMNPETTTWGHGEDEAKRQALREQLTEKYGFQSWYDFCVARWGTKWDVGGDTHAQLHDDELGFDASFESAWAPPVGVYEALVDQGFEVTAYYYEPGMQFVGKWEDGDDEYYEYGGATSDTIREVIGSELDDYFGISEELAQWEEENEQD